MMRLPLLPPAEELREIDAALARAADCPALHNAVCTILLDRRAVVVRALQSEPAATPAPPAPAPRTCTSHTRTQRRRRGAA